MAKMTCIMPPSHSTRHSLSTYLVLHICTKYSCTQHEQCTQQSNVHKMTLQHHPPVTEASGATLGVAEASEATCSYKLVLHSHKATLPLE